MVLALRTAYTRIRSHFANDRSVDRVCFLTTKEAGINCFRLSEPPERKSIELSSLHEYRLVLSKRLQSLRIDKNYSKSKERSILQLRLECKLANVRSQ